MICSGGEAQTAKKHPPKARADSDPPKSILHISVVSSVALFSPTYAIAEPQCGPKGMVFFRMPADNNILIGVSPDGRHTIRVAPDQITDLKDPKELALFEGDDGVYLYVGTMENAHTEKATVLVKKFGEETGKTVTRTIVRGDPSDYIARFDLDGQYKGSVKLDVPFPPSQIAVFDSGDFLVAGRDIVTSKPKVGVVNSSGRFTRFLELVGDVDPEVARGKDETRGDARKTALFAIWNSEFLRYQGKLLLVRRDTNLPVFEISPSGAVRPIRIQLPQGFTTFAIRAAGRQLLVQASRKIGPGPDGSSLEQALFLADPEDGHLVQKLVPDQPVGMGLGCDVDGEITFVENDPKKGMSIELLKGVPEDSRVN